TLGSRDNNIARDLTAGQWESILAFFGNACCYCGSKDGPTMDHLIPLSRGGGHTADNVAPACRHCNLVKGTRTPQEWLLSRRGQRPLRIPAGHPFAVAN
ncbi:MAG: HNH endonuclease, partial [Cyanobacteria bacterium REEB65]|nr:HNH endonuclease [Cyanobacteria bacterium REEB65]